ncbi:MAG: hypothetical protein IT449_06510 [Phycisphaerales bacterium]|nr:hypothetical protein [Phycisphaerales bacterium]
MSASPTLVAPRAAAPAQSSRGDIVAHPAIFTSIRTPTGEGYRIVAASKSLRPEERQVITRCSPSHDALCDASEGSVALACYPLPTGRICVAHTCPAGAEHTGRGGQRVYTYNLVVEGEDFARFGFNPFALLRAAVALGLTTPELKPREAMEPVRLPLDGAGTAAHGACLPESEGARWKRRVVHRLLRGAPVVLRVETAATQAAEVLWMSLPGPMRAKLSLSAGLRFSTSRPHSLVIVSAPDVRLKDLCESLDALLVDAARDPDGEAPPASAWLSFVEQHWRIGQVAALTERTSHRFEDISPEALERIGRLYAGMDELGGANLPRLLAIAEEFVDRQARGVEQRLRADLLESVRKTLADRLSHCEAPTLERHWPTLIALWRKSRVTCTFCEPLIQQALERLAGAAPVPAARLALAAARPVEGAVDESAHSAFLVRLLAGALAAGEAEDPQALADRTELANQWRQRRPDLAIPMPSPQGPP